MDSVDISAPISGPSVSATGRRSVSPPPPAVLPFHPPPLSGNLLSGSLDLLTHLQLLPAYDAFVRPYFRSARQPVPGSAPSEDTKGKGREQTLKELSLAGMNRKGGIMELKRMKGEFEDLVGECVVLSSTHPSIRMPPTSFRRLVMEGTDESGVPPPLNIRPIPKADLEQYGWRLAEGELPEAKDPSLFVRQEKPAKPKKKTKRPRPDDIPGGPTFSDAKRLKESHGGSPAGSALTPRTPGMGAGTPSGRTPAAAAGRGRTPAAAGTPVGGR